MHSTCSLLICTCEAYKVYRVHMGYNLFSTCPLLFCTFEAHSFKGTQGIQFTQYILYLLCSNCVYVCTVCMYAHAQSCKCRKNLSSEMYKDWTQIASKLFNHDKLDRNLMQQSSVNWNIWKPYSNFLLNLHIYNNSFRANKLWSRRAFFDPEAQRGKNTERSFLLASVVFRH